MVDSRSRRCGLEYHAGRRNDKISDPGGGDHFLGTDPAENAIKLFASRRNSVRTPFSEDGIRDYLLLLSIYQTLRYRHLSFWKFLISGETDIAMFDASRR